MSTFAVTNSSELLPAVNYLLSNLDTSGGTGNVVIPGNVLVANTTTGVVSQYGNATPFGYLYQYVNLRYSNNATGTAGFDTNSNNYSYFGVYNSATPTPSANPSAYQWYQVSPPFDSASNRTLYYSAIGGRQVQWAAASSPPSTGFQVTVANVAIDLDVVTTATGTPGERGPLGMAYVITTADPGNASSSTLTGWFESSRTANTPPIGTGLAVVTGDTAYFTYPTTGQSSTFTYNGSVWNSAVGQVVAGETLVANSVPGSSLANGAVTGTKIASNTISGNNIINSTITGNLIANSTISGNNIAAGTITGSLIAGQTIAGFNILGNTITGDLIAANAITGNKIAGNTITGNLIQGNTITGNLIQGNTITGNLIQSNTITGNLIAANTIAAVNIVTGTITGNLIAGNTITGNLIAGNTITGNLIAASTITGNLIAASTITGNKIAAATITSNLITANAITSNLIAANAVTSTSISAGAITTDKLAANLLITQNIQSLNSSFGQPTSAGYWLRGSDGAARFGGSINIGNNCSIGGNLSVTGLITSGNLIANTVATTTVVPQSINQAVIVVNTSASYPGSGITSGIPFDLSGGYTVTYGSNDFVFLIPCSFQIQFSGGSGTNTLVDIDMMRGQIIPGSSIWTGLGRISWSSTQNGYLNVSGAGLTESYQQGLVAGQLYFYRPRMTITGTIPTTVSVSTYWTLQLVKR